MIENLALPLSVQWLNPCNMFITANGQNPSSTVVQSGENSHNNSATFMPLQTSHGGTYTCVAGVSIPGTTAVQTVEATNIAVQSKWILKRVFRWTLITVRTEECKHVVSSELCLGRV